MAESLTLSQQKHLDILEAAKAAFLECGFDNVSMDAIADRASVSKRTVYNHFESKEALFEAITELVIQRFKEESRVDYDASRPLDEQLRKVADVQVKLETNEDVLAMVRMLLAGMLASPTSCREALKRAKEKEDPFEDWIQAAVDDGRLVVDDVHVALRLFRAMLESIFFWPGITGVPDVPTGARRAMILDHAVRMFLGFYSKAELEKK